MDDSTPADDPKAVKAARRRLRHEQRWEWPLLAAAILLGFSFLALGR
jgi:hypothetical protein